MNLDTEGLWLIATLCALPFAAFGIFELIVLRRRRRDLAIAQRRKSSRQT